MRRTSTMSVLVASLLLAGCGGSGPSASDGERVLVYGTPLTSNVSGRLDPALSTSVCDTGTMFAIYDSLVHRDPVTNEPLPGLAESWQVTSPTTLELTLREGVTFHNGAAFDAAAVKAGLEHIMAGAGQPAIGLGTLVSSIEAVDAGTVRITLSQPAAGSLPLILSGREGMIIAPGTGATADSQPVGAGAFSFVGQVPGQSIELARAPGYWDAGSVRLAGIRLVNAEIGPPTVNALIAGEIDMADVTAADVAAVGTRPELALTTQPAASYYKLNMDLSAAPFSDLRFRQALNHAIDREEIRRAVFADLGEVAWSPFPSGFGGFAPETEGQYAHDPGRARQLVTDAGLAGTTITAFIPANPLFRRFGEVVQAQLAEAGITLEFRQSADGVQDYFTDRELPALLTVWPPRPDPVDTLLVQFTPGTFNNVGGYRDPALDDMVARARAVADPAERNALLQQASRLVVDQALDLPAVFVPLLKAHTTDVVGGFRQFEQCQLADFSTVSFGGV